MGKVIQQYLMAPPPKVRDFRADAPEALDEILARALTKDRAGRYQTAEAMTEALRLVAAAETLERSLPTGTRRVMTPAELGRPGAPAEPFLVRETPAASRRDRRLVIAMGALALVAIAALVFVLLTR